jgi:hypothetical protein
MWAAAASIVVLAIGMVLAVHYGPDATAADSGPPATSAVRSARDFDWRQSPDAGLTSTGKNSLTLNPCPPGVLATEPAYYVYITGTGTPEAVRVTGGSCKGDGHAGTLEFVAASSHPLGYVIGSASSGIQEASIAARYSPSNPQLKLQAGRVIVPPGEYEVFAPISIRASNQTLEFQGSVLNCYTANDACLFVGDPKNANWFENITLQGPRGRPMVMASTKPFIEVNAMQTRVFNVSTRWPSPKGASFGSYVQVDDDQAFLLDGMDISLGGSAITCNPSYCGAFISAPGPFNKWSAVGWLKNLNLSLQCAGKGVEWLSGNSLRISDSVIQGWSVFGVRVSNQRGGYAGLITDNVYFEPSGGCKDASPYGNVGSAAIIAEGVQVKIGGLEANSPMGIYPNWGAESGSHDWLYWVVPVHAKFGEGVPLPAGHAYNNGSGNVTGTFPKIAGASSYKVLRMDWDRNSIPRPYPEGTGHYLVTTVPQSSCATLTCSFTDSGGSLSSYTNAAENLAASVYMPRLDFWPGAIVYSPQDDATSASMTVPVLPIQADQLGVGSVVSTLPSWAVSAEAGTLFGSPATPPAAANIEALHTSGIAPFPGATILNASNLPQTSPSGHKGRLNFGHRGDASGFTPIITLGDSNWGKTWATASHRPPADANDLDMGYEGNIDTSYSRAQNEMREYIGKFPDGNPQEKLSAAAKTFNVPVTINGNLRVTGKCEGCGTGSAGSSQWNVARSGQKAAIATTSLCAPSACGAGLYRVSYYLDSSGACTQSGNAATAFTIGWNDESSPRSLRVPLTGTGVVAGNSLSLGQSTSFGTGNVLVWSSGKAAITYSTAYTACAAGQASYAVHVQIEKVQ